MSLSATDKRDIILNYIKELNIRPIEISRGTGEHLFTVTQMIRCEDWPINEVVLDNVLTFLETGKPAVAKPVCCTGSADGCATIRQCLADKDHLLATQEETIKMLRDELARVTKKK